MPTIDVTSPLIAGLNAASGALGGFSQAFLAGKELQQRAQSMEDDRTYRDALLTLRHQEMARDARRAADEARYRQGVLDLNARELDIKEREVEEERKGFEATSTWGSKFAEEIAGTDIADTERRLSEQEANVAAFADSLSPEAQRVFRPWANRMLGVERERELAKTARMGAARLWAGALKNPALSQVPGIQELAQEKIAALEAGTDSVARSMADFEQVRSLAAKELAAQQDLADGEEWARAQIQEAKQGGGDWSKMNRALTDWLTLPDSMRKTDDLKRDLLKARHGLEMDTYKIGDVEVPSSLKATSSEWAEIAESESNREVAELMAKDPWVKKAIDDGDLTQEKYLEWRERHRRSILRGYGARAGLTMDQMRARGWIDSAREEAGMEARQKAIEEAAKKDNLDLDMPWPPPGASEAGTKRPATPSRLGSRERPMLETLDRSMKNAEDAEFNEKDIDEVYGTGPR